MAYYRWKKAAAICLSAAMAVSLAACGNSKKADTNTKKSKASEEKTTEVVKKSKYDYVKDGVEIPKNFDNMIYPLTALATQAYANDLPYYAEDQDSSKSFWFSMAVLTSEMYDNASKKLELRHTGKYVYPTSDTTDMLASSLYADYGKGEIEFPEVGDDNQFATYDDDNDLYGFILGSINDLKVEITDCKEKGSDYDLTLEVYKGDSEDPEGTYEAVLEDSTYDGDADNVFAYSVKAFGDEGEVDTEDSDEEDSESTGSTTDFSQTSDENSDEDDTTEEDEDTTKDYSDTEDDEDSSSSSLSNITQSDAKGLAEDSYGSDYDYSYKGSVKVGGKEYYDFSVSGSDSDISDVLVSKDGEDVVGGSKNSDGTWSLDQ